MTLWRKWGAAAGAALILLGAGGSQTKAVSTTTMQITLGLDQPEAVVNGAAVPVDPPAVILEDKTFVPAKFLGDTMGVKVEWNAKTGRVEMDVPKVKVEFDLARKLVFVNGVQSPFEQVAALVNERLMVKLSWFGDLVGAKYSYDHTTRSIGIVYVKKPDDLYNGELDNSRPVAKFTFAKPSYRLGEPVKYVDLSYDPDAEGIVSYEWTGKQEAFFTPGTYPISLKVKDSKGHVSATYTRQLIIEPTPYLDELSYKLQFWPAGSRIKTDWGMIYSHFYGLPALPARVAEDRSRPLIVSDSPESIKEKGILYQEKVHGKARLYADHVNEMAEKVQFVIMAKNTSGRPVKVTTTNKGEVFPSSYANLIGHEASVDFMLHDPIREELVIPAGQSYVYVLMPDFYPGQGVNVFYDVETDGEVEFQFIAMDNIASPNAYSVSIYRPLDYVANVRGTFPVSEKTWNVNLNGLAKPARLTIGDGKEDPFDKGYDNQRKQEVYNEGNYGMIYKIHAERPGRMAVLLLPRGGPFKGPFKVNGEFTMAPTSGVLGAFEQVQLLARTTGEEETFEMEFTPPAGSAFPVDLIFYPLDEVKP
ncbi:stalk domain-containing protein [Paenibacillus aurantius]|uniref:Stalk domain-containing protein n=1 Tax=Paenibacillus aurantius TaxID=2918900 RepID=A0AA96LC63_9BACL|nr:stalk domain-containing protein [Paenibacillus aurantius]WNQ11017.1 stalk domain-containing protein [Paenibacillus aurantius]